MFRYETSLVNSGWVPGEMKSVYFTLATNTKESVQ